MNSAEFSALMKPKAFVVSDQAHASKDAKRALKACSFDFVDHIGLENAAAALQSAALPDLVLVSLSDAASEHLTGSIEAISATATSLHCPLVLAAPLSIIDSLPSRVWSASQALLTEATEVDFAAAIAVAAGSSPQLLNDASRDLESARLQRLADEVGRIARTLASLSAAAPMPNDGVADVRPSFIGEPVMIDPAPSAAEVRAIIRMRRLRDRFFDRDLFADPAWDMLLDLMAARIERVQVAVSSLCIAACVPPTTALRWIKAMTDSGLFDRIADPDDGRRIFIRLSDSAASHMNRYFGALRSANEMVI